MVPMILEAKLPMQSFIPFSIAGLSVCSNRYTASLKVSKFCRMNSPDALLDILKLQRLNMFYIAADKKISMALNGQARRTTVGLMDF